MTLRWVSCSWCKIIAFDLKWDTNTESHKLLCEGSPSGKSFTPSDPEIAKYWSKTKQL